MHLWCAEVHARRHMENAMKPNDMPAGPNMDRMIAEQVLGWKRGKMYGNRNGEWIIPGRENDTHPRTWDQTPRFSTDILAAWMIVGHMQYIHLMQCKSLDGMFKCEMRSGSEDYSTWAETAPLAICRAALIAKEKQRPVCTRHTCKTDPGHMGTTCRTRGYCECECGARLSWTDRDMPDNWRRIKEAPTAPKCPNPNCENGLIKGTGVGCAICEAPIPVGPPTVQEPMRDGGDGWFYCKVCGAGYDAPLDDCPQCALRECRTPNRSTQFRRVVEAMGPLSDDRLRIINAALWDIREKNPHANVAEVAEAVDCALAAWEVAPASPAPTAEPSGYTREDLEAVAREAVEEGAHISGVVLTPQRRDKYALPLVTRYLERAEK